MNVPSQRFAGLKIWDMVCELGYGLWYSQWSIGISHPLLLISGWFMISELCGARFLLAPICALLSLLLLFFAFIQQLAVNFAARRELEYAAARAIIEQTDSRFMSKLLNRHRFWPLPFKDRSTGRIVLPFALQLIIGVYGTLALRHAQWLSGILSLVAALLISSVPLLWSLILRAHLARLTARVG